MTESTHAYGKNVHLLNDPFHQNLLTEFSQEAAQAPRIFDLARGLSRYLTIEAMNLCFPQVEKKISTRMITQHPEAAFVTKVFDRGLKVVVVDLMRAGILPSQTAYETLVQVLDPKNIRQDHLLLNRETDDKGQVTGTKISGHKIGGGVDKSFVIIADPMGATGSTLSATIDLYKGLAKNKKSIKFIALHFIVTPEFLRRVSEYSDCLEIFSLRLDRGLSPKSVLKTIPGERWSSEKGLNDLDYIVPGAGGIGELLNNSFV